MLCLQSNRKQQQQRLTKDFQARAKKFTRVMKEALNAEQRVVARARASIADAAELDDGSDEEATEALLKLRAQDQELDLNEELIAEREEEIAKIQGEMREVNEVFQDLAVLVDEQGHDIDNIEFNVVEAETRAAAGVDHLKSADKLASKANSRTLCILFLIFAAAGGLVAYLMLTHH